MTKIHNKILPEKLVALYRRYEHLDARSGDMRYLRAVQSLDVLYRQLEQDAVLVDAYLEAIIDDYERRQAEMLDLLLKKEFESMTKNARQLVSGLRLILPDSAIQEVVKMEEASLKNNFQAIAESWYAFQQRLFPIFSVLRKFRDEKTAL